MGTLLLKEILSEKKITGKDLAKRVGLTETSISRIVNGGQLPKLETLFKIANALDVNIRDFFPPSGSEMVPVYIKNEKTDYVEVGQIDTQKFIQPAKISVR